MQDQANRLVADGQVVEPACVVAVNTGRGLAAVGARSARHVGKSRQDEAGSHPLNIENCDLGNERGEQPRDGAVENICTHARSIADASAICLSTEDAEEPKNLTCNNYNCKTNQSEPSASLCH